LDSVESARGSSVVAIAGAYRLLVAQSHKHGFSRPVPLNGAPGISLG
jgi:hypothetical protein